MKIVVFGATAGVGLEGVKQALARGHTVTAFARTPAKLTLQDERLSVFQGDVRDVGRVQSAVAGQDAVICALGAAGLVKRDTTCSEGTRNILAAMAQQGVKRLVVCSAAGVGDSKHQLPLLARLALSRPYADKVIQEALIRASAVDWVIVRPVGLRDYKPRKEDVAVVQASEPVPTLSISRADVADFMLEQCEADAYLRQTVSLAWR